MTVFAVFVAFVCLFVVVIVIVVVIVVVVIAVVVFFSTFYVLLLYPDHSPFIQFAEPAIWPSSIKTKDPICTNHVDVLTARSVFLRISVLHHPWCPVSIGKPARKIHHWTNFFVDGDLAELIKRRASDWLGDLVPYVQARASPGVVHRMVLLGLCLEISFYVLLSYPGQPFSFRSCCCWTS